MKTLLIALLLLPALALGAAARVPSSGSSPTIPTAFTADNANSEVMTCGNSNAVKIYNETSGVLAVGFGSDTNAPTAVVDYCPAGTGTVCVIAIQSQNFTLYIRSDTGSTITSGVVRATCINE